MRHNSKKKNGKRVSWGTTQVTEFPRFNDLELWNSAESRNYSRKEKTIEPFWGIGKNRWTIINDEEWEEWNVYQEGIGPYGPSLYEQYLSYITC